MTDTARVLLTAAVLSGIAIGVFAWRLVRTDPSHPARLVGELRLAQIAALLLAALGAVPVGLAIAALPLPGVHLDAALGLAFIVGAAVVLRQEPREALALVAIGFILHALFNVAHRPGWLRPDLAPRWYLVGCAIYAVYLAAVCYWARRR